MGGDAVGHDGGVDGPCVMGAAVVGRIDEFGLDRI